MMFKEIASAAFIACIYTDCCAQSRTKTKGLSGELSRYSFIPQAGLTQFYGELNDQDMCAVGGLQIRRDFSSKASLAFSYTSGKLGGEKKDFFNSYFINQYNTAELLARWDVSEQFRGREPPELHFSVYGGVGLMVFRAQAFDLGTNEVVRYTNSSLSARNPLFLKWGPPKGPAGIKNTREGILPVGIAFDFELFESLWFGIDGRFYFIRTDKADATSGYSLLNPEESRSYSDTPNDKYSFLSVSVTYRLNSINR